MLKIIRRVFSFADWSASHPATPHPGDMLDAQFDEIIDRVDEWEDRISKAVTPDGKIAYGALDNTSVIPQIADAVFHDASTRINADISAISIAAGRAAEAKDKAEAALIRADALQAQAALLAGQLTPKQAEALAALAAAISEAERLTIEARSLQDDWTNAQKDAFAADQNAMLWATVSHEWAEHMPDTIPPNILAEMGLTGDHWSSRWWANYAASIFGGAITWAYLGAFSVPPTSDAFGKPLQEGQLYFDTDDNMMYVWDGAAWRSFSNVVSTSGVTMSPGAPASPAPGNLWWETDSGNIYVWYVDATSGQWVEVGSGGIMSNSGVAFQFPDAPTADQVYQPLAELAYVWKPPVWNVLGSGGVPIVPWDNISGKPATFPPTLPIPSSGVTGLDAYQAAQDDRLDDIETHDANQDINIAAKADKAYVDSQNAAQDVAIAAKPSKSYVDTGDLNTMLTLIGGATSQMDTLGEIEGYINTSMLPNINGKANIASPVFTGDPRAPTPTAGDNDTSIATTGFVVTAISGKADKSYVDTQDATKAPLASPVFTGNPTAPTPAAADNDTSVATTAFVKTAIAGAAAATFIGVDPPPTPTVGQMWWDSDSGKLFIFYNDGNTTQWVEASNLRADLSGYVTDDELAAALVPYVRDEAPLIGPTPTIAGGTVAGVGTYTSQLSRYVKQGRLVFFENFIAWTAHTGTGNLLINNALPVAPLGNWGTPFNVHSSGLTLPAGQQWSALNIPSSSQNLALQMIVSNAVPAYVQMDSAVAFISVSGTYISAA